MDFDQPAAGRIRDAVGIAADADHAFARNAALQLQHRAERSQGQWSQMRPFFGEGLVDYAQRRGMEPRIGDGIEPIAELVQVVEIAEGARQEDVLPDISEWPLDPAFGLGAIGSACLGVKAVVAGQIDECAVIDDALRLTFADDRCLYSVIGYPPAACRQWLQRRQRGNATPPAGSGA